MLRIYFNNIKNPCFKRKIKKIFSIALEKRFKEGRNFEVGIKFLNGEEIKNLNQKFRDVPRETDVLSFPIYDFKTEQLPSEEAVMLGDIVICKEIAILQAKKYCHSLMRELCFLALHGFLHLLGFDHVEPLEEEEMKKFSEEILNEVGAKR